MNLGANRWGGYSQFIRVPADWPVPLPDQAVATREHDLWHRRFYGRPVRRGAVGPRRAARTEAKSS